MCHVKKWIHIASSKEDLDVEATPAEDLELWTNSISTVLLDLLQMKDAKGGEEVPEARQSVLPWRFVDLAELSRIMYQYSFFNVSFEIWYNMYRISTDTILISR